MITKRRVQVGSIAASLVTSETVVLANLDPAVSFFVGDVAVTAVDGFEIRAGHSYSFDLQTGQSLYAVTAAVDVNVLVLEEITHNPQNIPINLDLASEFA